MQLLKAVGLWIGWLMVAVFLQGLSEGFAGSKTYGLITAVAFWVLWQYRIEHRRSAADTLKWVLIGFVPVVGFYSMGRTIWYAAAGKANVPATESVSGL